MMDINETAGKAYRNADAHGWHEEDRTFGDLISLCHAELSEAIEHFRNGMRVDEIVYDDNHLNADRKSVV